MKTFSRILLVIGINLILSASLTAQQRPDPEFNTVVERPAFSKNFPRVLFDEAHNNFHTTTGRYKPFADLISNDGYHVVVNRKPFTKASLDTFKILIIANARITGVDPRALPAGRYWFRLRIADLNIPQERIFIEIPEDGEAERVDGAEPSAVPAITPNIASANSPSERMRMKKTPMIALKSVKTLPATSRA